MSEPFIAEIRIFAGDFAPRGWAFCNGQLLPIAQNTALFALVGTIYGGDGQTNFALPNLQGRTPMHPGSGPGLTTRRLGESGGEAMVTLSEGEMPAHTHPPGVKVLDTAATTGTPSTANTLAVASTRTYGPAQDLELMAKTAGGDQSHNNRQPFLGINFIIALVGLPPLGQLGP